MKANLKFCVVMLLALLLVNNADAAKLVKVRLTGTCRENIEVTFGNTGRKEIICNLPVVYEIPKEQLPLTLTFKSDNYIYYSIQVPRKPFDTTGHVYLVKIDDDATDRARNSVRVNHTESGNSESTENHVAEENVQASDVDMNIPIAATRNENTFAVIISNEKYQEEVDVKFASNDGRMFREYCLKTLGIPDKNIHYRNNATLNNMNSEVVWMKNVAEAYGKDANFIFYYAGHGVPDESTGDAYLLPVDGKGTMLTSGYSLKKLYETFGTFSAQSVTVFMDACFSGSRRDGGMLMEARGIAIKSKPSRPKGNVVVLSASQGDETAYPYEEKRHGLFTYFLLKKLQETKGKVDMQELSDYVKTQVDRRSIVENGKSQTPAIFVSEGMQDKWKSLKLNK